ncbi:MAG: TonB-dependent receptor [Sphingomonadales bacterium]
MRFAIALAMLAISMPVLAQEIVVTAQRRTSPTAADTTGIGIKRRADFAVQVITVYGDAREKDMRRREILTTVRNAIELGAKRQVQLAYGEVVIQPLTVANYADKLKFEKDEDRDDAEQVSFIIKTPLSDGNAPAAFDRLAAFAKAVPLAGRALIKNDVDPGVSIVDPSQYRPQILAAIAADATTAAKLFGSDYAVEADSLARPVRWALTGPTEVLLYIDHELRVVPKR